MHVKRSGVGNARTLKIVGTLKMAVLFPPSARTSAMHTQSFHRAMFGTHVNGVRDLGRDGLARKEANGLINFPEVRRGDSKLHGWWGQMAHPHSMPVTNEAVKGDMVCCSACWSVSLP